MTRPFLLLTAILCLIPPTGSAQQTASDTKSQNSADAPATREDVERYLEITHSRDMMNQVMAVTAKQTHEMVRQQLAKDKDKLPADFEARVEKFTDDMLRNFPVDDMLQAMIPVYQKHWTKGDVDAMVAFYSSPTGQKLLREMPTTMAEAMQALQPIMQKMMTTTMDRVQEEVAQMIKESDSAKKAQKPQSN
jgi:uncharacterized protein